MLTYSIASIATWTSEKSRILTELAAHKENARVAREACSGLEEQLRTLITETINPEQIRHKNIKAKINILEFAAQIERLSIEIENQETTLALLKKEKVCPDSMLALPDLTKQESVFSEELTRNQRALAQAFANFEASKSLVDVMPDAMEFSGLQLDACMLTATLGELKREQQQLEILKDIQLAKISESSQAISKCEASLSDMAKNRFMTDFTENPDALFNKLAFKVQQVLMRYDSAHPYKQPISIRQIIAQLHEKQRELSMQAIASEHLQWRTVLMYGIVWDAITQLEGLQEEELKKSLISAFEDQAFDKEESVATYKGAKDGLLPPMTADRVYEAEYLYFKNTAKAFQEALTNIPKNAVPEQRYFYKQGQTLLNTIQKGAEAANAKKDTSFALKYYTNLVNQANCYLSDPTNPHQAEAFQTLANMNTDDQSSWAKTVTGAALIFAGIGVLIGFLSVVTLAPAFISLVGIGIIPVCIAVELSIPLLTLGGYELFNNGYEKGVLKQSHEFDTATKVSSLSLWSKPTSKVLATAVPVPSLDSDMPCA